MFPLSLFAVAARREKVKLRRLENFGEIYYLAFRRHASNFWCHFHEQTRLRGDFVCMLLSIKKCNTMIILKYIFSKNKN